MMMLRRFTNQRIAYRLPQGYLIKMTNNESRLRLILNHSIILITLFDWLCCQKMVALADKGIFRHDIPRPNKEEIV